MNCYVNHSRLTDDNNNSYQRIFCILFELFQQLFLTLKIQKRKWQEENIQSNKKQLVAAELVKVLITWKIRKGTLQPFRRNVPLLKLIFKVNISKKSLKRFSYSQEQVSLFHVKKIGVNLNGSLGNPKRTNLNIFNMDFKTREFLSPGKYWKPDTERRRVNKWYITHREFSSFVNSVYRPCILTIRPLQLARNTPR